MNTLNQLPKSEKALRLRAFDNATKSKVILDIKWHRLGGNKAPYLSMDLITVKKDGVVLDHAISYSDRIATACEIAPQFAPLLNAHLVSWDGGGHGISNALYFAKQTIEHSLNKSPTKEQLTAQHDQLINDLWGCKLGKCFAKVRNLPEGITKMYSEPFYDLTRVKDSIKKNWRAWTRGFSVFTKQAVLNEWIDKLESTIKKVRNIKGQMISAPYAKDVWTVKRLSDHTGIPQGELALLLLADFKSLESRICEEAIQQLEELKTISINLQIPLVITK